MQHLIPFGETLLHKKRIRPPSPTPFLIVLIGICRWRMIIWRQSKWINRTFYTQNLNCCEYNAPDRLSTARRVRGYSRHVTSRFIYIQEGEVHIYDEKLLSSSRSQWISSYPMNILNWLLSTKRSSSGMTRDLYSSLSKRATKSSIFSA